MKNRRGSQKNITAELENGKILPLIVRLSIPAVIAQLITFLYNIVDRMYVARMDGDGMDALAALGIVLAITLIIQAFANLIGLGGSPRAGIRLGEDNRAEANRIFNTSFLLLFLLGALIGAVTFFLAEPIVLLFGCPPSAVEFAASYLKIYSCGTVFVMLAQGLNPFILTQGYSFIAMSSVLVGAVANIALDPLFIFTFGMGVKGSSLATILSQFISCVCIVCFFFSRKSLFRFRVGEMRFSFARLADILSLGFTPFVMTLTECAIQVVFNINLNRATGGDKDYTATLVGEDTTSDIAVIKIDADGLTPATVGNSDGLKVGQSVMAVGNPLGELGGTVTSGIVSALNRSVSIQGSSSVNTMSLIQMDASVSPGNSGGGLFNMNGELIGIVNAKSSSSDAEGLGFAIPINDAIKVAQELLENGYVTGRPYLGITYLAVEDAQTAAQLGVNAYGVYVVEVVKGGPAEKAGLQAGDRIVSVDGTEIASKDDLGTLMQKHAAGDTLSITIAREGQMQTVNVTLGEKTASNS